MIDFVGTYAHVYLAGALAGLLLAFLAFAGSLAIGLVAAFGRVSDNRGARTLSGAYVALFRGIPPLLMLYVVYFGLPTWAHDHDLTMLAHFLTPLNNRLFAAAVAFAINSGAYSCEIIRASILSIHSEQMEAARSLGMSYALAMRRIILPQAWRVSLPPLGNEFIVVLKGTSLASVIGVTELMRDAQLAASATFEYLYAYSFAAAFYVVFVIALQNGLRLVEKHYGRWRL